MRCVRGELRAILLASSSRVLWFIEARWKRWKINGGSSNPLGGRRKGERRGKIASKHSVGSDHAGWLVYIPASLRGEVEENRNSLRVGEAGTLLLTFTLDPFT